MTYTPQEVYEASWDAVLDLLKATESNLETD